MFVSLLCNARLQSCYRRSFSSSAVTAIAAANEEYLTAVIPKRVQLFQSIQERQWLESQINNEVRGVLEYADYVYKVLGFEYELKLSTRPEKYLGKLETWNRAEAAMKEALNEFGKPWQKDEGNGAFYGPRIDIIVSGALKRKHEFAKLQLDFQLPDIFKLKYSAKDGVKFERLVMIHTTIVGSLERMCALLLEHYRGNWPFWLSPRQVIVCPFSAEYKDYAKKVRISNRGKGNH